MTIESQFVAQGRGPIGDSSELVQFPQHGRDPTYKDAIGDDEHLLWERVP